MYMYKCIYIYAIWIFLCNIYIFEVKHFTSPTIHPFFLGLELWDMKSIQYTHITQHALFHIYIAIYILLYIRENTQYMYYTRKKGANRFSRLLLYLKMYICILKDKKIVCMLLIRVDTHTCMYTYIILHIYTQPNILYCYSPRVCLLTWYATRKIYSYVNMYIHTTY